MHVFEWCGDAHRVWPPSSSFPYPLLKPRQHFSAMSELSGRASAQTGPLLSPEHGGWVSVNIIQQRTLLVAWRVWGHASCLLTTCVPFMGPKATVPCHGWMCTQHVVKTMKGLVMLDLNSVHAMEGALSMCPSSVSLRCSAGLTRSQSASSQLQAPMPEYNDGCAQELPGLHRTALRRERRKVT